MVRRYEIPLAAAAMAIALTAMACRGGESPPQGGQTAGVIQNKAPVNTILPYGPAILSTRAVPTISLQQASATKKPDVR